MLTEIQSQIWELMKKGMSQRAIAEKLGKSKSTVGVHCIKIKKQMVKHPTNPLFNVDKMSELIDNRTGESVMTWYKSSKEVEDMTNLVDTLCERIRKEVRPLPKTPKVRMTRKKDLFNAYYLGDPHMNMLSWARETGRDWDLNIALKHHDAAMNDLLSRAPNASEGMLVTLGDLFHNDSLKAITPGSGNVVDVDGRLMKSWDATVLMVERILQMMLKQYDHVHYICVPGNHSETLERVFAACLKISFKNEKRITVHDNVRKHIPFVWEKNFILATHGDRLSPQKKADIAVAKYRDLHGAANFTHVVTGHLHHNKVDELSGAMVEIFSVLTPPDAWHMEGGYVTSRQAAHQITYHKEGGIYCRSETNPRIYLK